MATISFVLGALIALHAVSAATTSLTLNFAFSGTGRSRNSDLTYSFINNVGSVSYRGKPYRAVTYYTQQMGSYKDFPNNLQARWIDWLGIALDGSDLMVGYIDCDPTNSTAPVQCVTIATAWWLLPNC